MTRAQPAIVAVAGAVASMLVLSGCSGSDGSVSFRNYGSADVEVSSGNESFAIASGDISELQDDCTDGDVVISFAGATPVTVAGPVCSEQAVVIRDETAVLVASTTAPEQGR